MCETIVSFAALCGMEAFNLILREQYRTLHCELRGLEIIVSFFVCRTSKAESYAHNAGIFITSTWNNYHCACAESRRCLVRRKKTEVFGKYCVVKETRQKVYILYMYQKSDWSAHKNCGTDYCNIVESTLPGNVKSFTGFVTEREVFKLSRGCVILRWNFIVVVTVLKLNCR